MTKDTRPLVVVLFGGQSGEHQISCATAGGVLRAVDPKKWRTLAVGIAPTGEWVPMSTQPHEYDLGASEGYTVPVGDKRVAMLPGTPTLIQYEVDEKGSLTPGTMVELGEMDVVFPLLHGPFGEDGTAQGLFEMSAVRYVGCGVAASAVAQDKYLAKTVLAAAGIDVGEWVSFTKREWDEDEKTIRSKIASLEYPVFVKPTRAGSSLGITQVKQPEDLQAAVEEASQHDPRLIVERAVKGRELECGILGKADGTILASKIGEIKVVGDAGFYDYESKYFDEGSVILDCPARVADTTSKRLQGLARRAFAALEGEGISRVDFFHDEEGDRIILNEVNTMPGFTPFSMYPAMFAAAGIDYPTLVDELLEEAMARPIGLR